MKRLWLRLMCFIGNHDWTCLHDEGVKPDPDRVRTDTARYWREYSRVYCRHCRTPSSLT